MIFTPLHKTNKIKITPTCTANEYPHGDRDLWGSVIEIHGRYPENGYTVNEKCKELVYFIDGVGKLVVNGKTTKVQIGDQVLIAPGEKFYWVGDLVMFMPCSPAWYPEQHKQIE